MMRVGTHHLTDVNPNHAFNVDFMWSPALQWGLWFISGWAGSHYAVTDDFGNLVRVQP